MKLAFTNLLALITVSLVLVTIESQQASALEDGELYVKRNNAGHSVPAGPRGGSRAGGGAATGGAGNKRPATTAGTTGRNTKPLTQTPSAGAGGAGAGTGRGKGGAGGGGIAGGGGAGGGRRGGGGGGSQPKPKARMAKRQVKEESDHEKRDLNAEVILEKRFGGPPGLEWSPKAKRSTYDEQAQLEKRDPKNPNGMHPIKRDNSGNLVKRDPHGHSLPRRPRRMMKRNVGLEGKSFLVKRNHGMPGPHGMAGPPHGMGGHHGGGGMMKREVNLPANQYGLIKRSPEPHKGPHGGGGGGFRGRGPPRGMGMMKREVNLQTNQYDLIKRSPEPHRGPHGGDGFKGRGGPPGGMGMMKRSLGGKERFSSTSPRYSKRSNDQ